MRLQNKIAIVTAASSGIGLGCAHRLASEGAKVLNADLRQPSEEIEQRFRNLPGEWKWIEADLGDREVPAKVVSQALELWGGVDVLVNNAAYLNDQSGALLQTDLEQWDRQFAITVTGTFLMTKLCVPEMIKRGGGSIVNISSIGGINPFGEGTAYCTAKAAVLAVHPLRCHRLRVERYPMQCGVPWSHRHAHLWQHQECPLRTS